VHELTLEDKVKLLWDAHPELHPAGALHSDAGSAAMAAPVRKARKK
jgi:hypothetical protein